MNTNQRRIRRKIRRDKTLAGAKSLPAIVANVFMGVALALVVLAVIDGFMNGWGTNIMHYVYAALQINYPQTGEMLQGSHGFHIAAFLIMGIVSFLLIPLLTAALNNWLSEKIQEIKEGRKVYKGLQGHYVLIGCNEFTAQIVSQVLAGNERYAVIMTMRDVITARERLEASLPAEIAARVLFYLDDAIGAKAVESLNLNEAEELFLLDESDGHDSRYSRNLTVVQQIAAACTKRALPLIVYMQVNNSTAYNLLQKVEIESVKSRKSKVESSIVLDLRPFNFCENWSRLLWSYYTLRRNGKPAFDPLDFEPLEGTNKHVHLVIAGFNSMGQALLLEALRLCHYPNYVAAKGKSKAKNKTCITVFDAQWNELSDTFLTQHGRLEAIEDIELTFHATDISSPSARKMLDEWARDTNTLLTIAVCDADAEKALEKAVNLPETVYYRREAFCYEEIKAGDKTQRIAVNNSRTRVLVRQHQTSAPDEMFAARQIGDRIVPHPTYPNLRLFGTIAEGVDLKQLNDDIPMCINGIYSEKSAKGEWLFYMTQLNECMAAIREAVGNKTKLSKWREMWLALSENLKWANRFQVDMYGYYMRVLERNSSLPNEKHSTLMEQLSETEHRRWLAERVVAGWRQCDDMAEGKINERRIHKCIVPYAELSDEEKLKDYNVIATAPILGKLNVEC